MASDRTRASTSGRSLSPGDDHWLAAWVGHAWRVWRLELLALAATVGVSATWALLGLGVSVAVAIVAGLAAAATLLVVRRRALHSDVAMITAAEQMVPSLQNALLAWRETHGTASRIVGQHLAAQARAALDGASTPRSVRRWHWGAVVLLAAVALLVHAVPRRTPSPRAAGSPASATRPPSAAPLTWTVTVTPPAHAGGPAVRLPNPSQVEALESSTLGFAFTGWPEGASLHIGTVEHPVTSGDGDARATVAATTSAVVSVEGAEGRVLASIALVVRHDAPPQVRITAPAADQRRDSSSGVVTVRVTARDDLGLRDLRLLFTRVSGSGESFTFVDGEWPLRVERASPTAWTGAYAIDLSRLGLGPGDSVVYHATAHDARPGREGAADSERFLIEITRPGALAAGDFSLPEPEDKFALSQRMVIQLTERLLERRPRMPAEEYREQAQALAVAQRSVRAEFVFMLGGEVEDEFEEAAHSHEVEAGRLDNRGQSDLTEAVRQMSQAERRLTDAAVREALPYEYKALAALQAAFGKARYFMRTLPAPVQIDSSRRLTGTRDGLVSAAWRLTPFPDTVRQDALAALADLEKTAGELTADVLGRMAALDTTSGGWVAEVQQVSAREGRAGLIRLLRARVASSSPHWFAVPLPRTADEASPVARR